MNLNIFKRIADLEAKVQELSGQHDKLRIAAASNADFICELQAVMKSVTQAKQTDADQAAKRKAYARAYYLKKKAEREGRKHINFVKVSK